MATYSFLDTQCAIIGPGGSFSLGSGAGVAEEGITIEMAEDKNVMTIGADGSGQHSLHASQAGMVTIRLLKTSDTNQSLSVMYDLQTSSSAFHGKNVISIRDPATGDSITCQQCAFKKAPNITYAKDGGTNEWRFDAVQINTILGAIA